MTNAAERILQEALQLDVGERALVARKLLESLRRPLTETAGATASGVRCATPLARSRWAATGRKPLIVSTRLEAALHESGRRRFR